MYEKYKVIPIITHKKIILPISEEANSNWPREYNEYFDNNVTQGMQPFCSGTEQRPPAGRGQGSEANFARRSAQRQNRNAAKAVAVLEGGARERADGAFFAAGKKRRRSKADFAVT